MTIVISGVGRHLVSDIKTKSLVITSLLPHEHRMSVINMAVRRHHLSGSLPIKSKSRLIFQVGWRRFAACPIFSQHTNGKVLILDLNLNLNRLLLREGFKKKKSIMENSILGMGGGQQGSFSISIFFLFFFAPNGLKIIFRH